MTDLLTPQDLQPLLADIIERMPDAINPMRGGGCVYSMVVDGVDTHCIAGQLAAEQGWATPHRDVTVSTLSSEGRLTWPLTHESVTYLTRIQGQADNITFDIKRSRVDGKPNEKTGWKDIDLGFERNGVNV